MHLEGTPDYDTVLHTFMYDSRFYLNIEGYEQENFTVGTHENDSGYIYLTATNFGQELISSGDLYAESGGHPYKLRLEVMYVDVKKQPGKEAILEVSYRIKGIEGPDHNE